MKSFLIAGMGAGILLATVPFVTSVSNWQLDSAVAQNTKNQPLQLRLAAEKQVMIKDQQGKQKVSWQALSGQTSVVPGDVLRYTLSGENKSDRPLKNLNLNQPIPKQMVFVLKSTNASQNTKVTYSIDGGKAFVENPTVKVKLPNGQVEDQPAPATAYTHIRFQIPSLAAKTTVKLSYQTQVR